MFEGFVDPSQLTSTWHHRAYEALISKAKSRSKIEGYTEKHHFIPKSFGGTNEHIVVLTGREHFIAHLLLSKMFKGRKSSSMYLALRIMSKRFLKGGYISSRSYELGKKVISDNLKGGTISDEHRAALSKAQKGKPKSDEHRLNMSEGRKGMKFSDEHRANIAKSCTGRKYPPRSQEYRESISERQRGKPRSEETRRKISEAFARRRALKDA